MGFAQGTEHYGLPQYGADDRPKWQTDITNAFQKIDETMYNVASTTDTTEGTVANLVSELNNTTATVTRNSQSIDNLVTKTDNIDSEYKIADTALSNRIASNTSNIASHTRQIDAINKEIADLSPEGIQEVTERVNKLEASVGDTDITEVSSLGTVTSGIKALFDGMGIETRVDPDDPTKAQWRAKGGETWQNFNGVLVNRTLTTTFTRTTPYQIPLTYAYQGKTLNLVGISQFTFQSTNKNAETNNISLWLRSNFKFEFGFSSGDTANLTIVAIYM